MGLFINSNLKALQTQRRLSETTSRLERSFERLASGLRVNSARDDAAGLMISTRMSAQLGGVRASIKNSNDAISLLQTTEGALYEVTQRLQRMRELNVQSLSDTLSDADRRHINTEFQTLSASIDEVARQASFNGVKLLEGDLLDFKLQVGATQDDQRSLTIGKVTSSELGRQAQRVSLRGVNTQIAIGERFSDARVLLQAAQPATLLSPEVIGVVDPNFPGTPDVVVSEAIPEQIITPYQPPVYQTIPGDDNTPTRRVLVTPAVQEVRSPAVPAVIITGEAPRYLVEPQEAVYSDDIPARYDYQYAGELTINGVKIRATERYDDPLSTAQRAGSAIAKAKAINAVSEQTGVRAVVGPTVLGSPSEVDAGEPTEESYRYDARGIPRTRTQKIDVSPYLPFFVEDTDIFLAIDNSASNGSNLAEFKARFRDLIQTLKDLSGGHKIRLGISFYGDHNLDPQDQMPDFDLVDLDDGVASAQLAADVASIDLSTINTSVAEDMHLSINQAQSQAWSNTARQHLIIIGQGDADNDGLDFRADSLNSADNFLNANTADLNGSTQRFISTMQIRSSLTANKLIFGDMTRNETSSSVWSPSNKLTYPNQILVTATGQDPDTIPHNTYAVSTSVNSSTDYDRDYNEFRTLTLNNLDFPLELTTGTSLSVSAPGAVIATTLTSGDLVINGVDVLAAGDLTVLADDSDHALIDRINSLTDNTGVVASLNNGALTLTQAQEDKLLNIFTTLHGYLGTQLEAQDNGSELVINGVKVPEGVYADASELAAALTEQSNIKLAVANDANSVEMSFTTWTTPVTLNARGLDISASGTYPVPIDVDRDDYYPAYEQLVGAIQGGGLDEVSYVEINGVKISGFEVEQQDASGALVAAINAEVRQTGVSARLDATSRLVLTAPDGRNIEVKLTGRAGSITGLKEIVQGGELTLHSSSAIAASFGLAGETDMNDALGDLGASAGDKIFGVSQDHTLQELSLIEPSDARLALRSVDLAIEQVNQRLSQLGAYQSQLEAKVRSLEEEQVSVSNARSAILDADVAQESAALAKQQVLQQAAASLLAQANIAPQLSLRLLESVR